MYGLRVGGDAGHRQFDNHRECGNAIDKYSLEQNHEEKVMPAILVIA
jgi:hypothetical protein